MNRVVDIPDRVRVRNVLISVSDKQHLDMLTPRLVSGGRVTIYSTGGTYDRIKGILGDKDGQGLKSVSSYTGQPEMQGGLVKTLDYRIYMGLLSEPFNQDHDADMSRTGTERIDMVVVNLYPFAAVAEKPESDIEDARGNIDIGGPCMLRAAAKNFIRVAAVCDPGDYGPVMDEIEREGGLSLDTRFTLAKKAFSHTAGYDAAVSGYLARKEIAEIAAVYDIRERV